MTGILLTKVDTPIIGWCASLLGVVMEFIYEILAKLGIYNLGITIILLTIVIYMCMFPLTLKQQKFTKMSAAMNPEINKIRDKYKNKKDEASMRKMQEETQLVYDKYGVSPSGSCVNMLIQMPFLFAVWSVIRNIPAYVGQVKEIYMPLVEGIKSTAGYEEIMIAIGEAKPIMISSSKFDYTQTNTLIDVLYKFQSSTWETLIEEFPALEGTIVSTVDKINDISNFMGLNIAESPINLIKSGFTAGTFGIAVMALMIPLLAGLTQYLSVKVSQSNTEINPEMAATMRSMNITMPLMSVFMCFTMPTGLGIYWAFSAVVRMVQQFFINRHLNKIPMDELIKRNMEKAEKKRENKKSREAEALKQMAKTNTRHSGRNLSDKEIEEKLAAARAKNADAPEGSLASKANLVSRYNEANRK